MIRDVVRNNVVLWTGRTFYFIRLLFKLILVYIFNLPIVLAFLLFADVLVFVFVGIKNDSDVPVSVDAASGSADPSSISVGRSWLRITRIWTRARCLSARRIRDLWSEVFCYLGR